MDKTEVKAYLRERKNAKCYYCILKWDENGKIQTKEVSTGVPIKGNNKREAKQRVEEIRQAYKEKIKVQKIETNQNLTFDQYIAEWLEGQKNFLKPTTYYGYEIVLNTHIIPYFRELKILLSDLTPKDIQTYYNYKLKQGLSANTIKHHHANIRKALQSALKMNMIPYNMADRTDLPKIVKYKPKIYDERQLTLLLEKVKNTPIESVVVICCHLGLRRGEVCGMRWIDVDFENRIIHIKHTRTIAKTEIVQDSAKTDSSETTLPISDSLYEYLVALKQQQNEDKIFFGGAYKDSGYVCRWDNGEELRVSYASHAFNDLLRKNDLPHIRLHDLRHSVATNLLNNGVDIKIIQEYLRHSTIATTANYYLHPSLKQKQDAANTMGYILKQSV